MRKALSIILMFIFLCSVASAATLQVPAKYKTIQSAVNSATTGDTICVSAGTYKENVIIADKSLSFVGQGGKYPTVYGFMMTNTNDMVGSANVAGFTINRDGVQGGFDGGNTIRNNKFVNCDFYGGSGSTFYNNLIINNLFTNGGVYFYDESRDNTIIGNTFSKSKIGICVSGGSICSSITKNTFSGCKVAAQLERVPSGMIGNIYKNNIVNIKIVPGVLV